MEKAIEAVAGRENQINRAHSAAINQTGKKIFSASSLKHVIPERERKNNSLTSQVKTQHKLSFMTAGWKIGWKVKIKVFVNEMMMGIILVFVGCYFKMLSDFFFLFLRRCV